jgi:hypothetical protein
MTVSTEIVTHSYFPGDAMAEEAIPFQFLEAADVVVSVANSGAPLVAGDDFVISGNGRTGTGKITTLKIFADDVMILLRRNTAMRQEAVTDPFKPLPAPTIERELDRRAMIEQEIGSFVSHALLLPEEEAATTIPNRADRALKYLAFDPTGAPVAVNGLVPLGDYFVALASEAIEPGDFVNIYGIGGSVLVRRALASDTERPAQGFTIAGGALGALLQVQFSGVNTAQLPGLFARQYLSDAHPGKATSIAPSEGGAVVQFLGIGLPGVGIRFDQRDAIFL